MLPDVQSFVGRQSVDADVSFLSSYPSPSIPAREVSLLYGARSDTLPVRNRHIEYLLQLTELSKASVPIPGNNAVCLIDGQRSFEAMMLAINGAKDHINFATYLINDDMIGISLADALIKKHREGVQVNFMYDSMGSRKTPEDFFDRLREAGINVCEFNPMNPCRKRDKRQPFYERDHRKLLVVDGALAITGGVNIGTEYYRELNDTADAASLWRDTDVRIEGPAAAEFQKVFLDTWKKQDGSPIPRGNYFPYIAPGGNNTVQVAASFSGAENRVIYMLYMLAFQHARQSIHITQAYFCPDKKMIEALCNAAQRGVDVKIILPQFSDHNLVLQAGRTFYKELLRAGVKLYERCCANLHAKTLVVDGIWSTIGSANLELWSLSISDELNAVVVGAEFGKTMETMFKADLADSRRITLEDWENRPLSQRMMQVFARLLRPAL